MKQAAGDRSEQKLVWDLPTRAFHWTLVACVAGSWMTHELGTQWFEWHERLGYATLVLVCFRIAWGFVGPRHARFSSFLRGPAAVADYARGLGRRDGLTTPGHNPLGGLAVIAMLGLLLFQGTTGLFANDEILSTGPLYGYVADETSDRLTGLHKKNFDLLLVLLGLHLAAVLFYLLWKRVDLVRPMFTGRKPVGQMQAPEGITGQRPWLAMALVAVFAGALWWVVSTAPPASLSFF